MSRKSEILDAGVALWPFVSARRIAERIGVSHPTVLNHIAADKLRDTIAEHAVAVDDMRVIRLLILDGHPAVAHIAGDDRNAYFKGV